MTNLSIERMKILGIETSCDETGVAVYDKKENMILTEQIFTQASKHAEYGGVVPELLQEITSLSCCL